MVLSTSATMRPAAVAAAAPGAPRWFQVYVFRDRGITQSLIDEACAHGYSALVLTVDVPILGRREGAVRVGFHIPDEFEVAGDIFGDIDPSVSWRDLEWIAGHGLPVVLKGILTPEDARLAVEHGAAAVVVSNHGGRQLDGVPASIDALPRGRRRPSAIARRSCSTAACAAASTSCAHSRSVREPCSSAVRLSTRSPRAGRRASFTSCSCCATRWSLACAFSGARLRPR